MTLETHYRDAKGRELYVDHGIGRPALWFTCYRDGRGRKHRVKSKYLPPRFSRFEAVIDLQTYAEKHQLEVVQGEKP